MKIKELEEKIKHHNKLYYNGESDITDDEYDLLVKELKKKDPKNKLLKQVGSPVEHKRWKKEKHRIKMGSLNKVADLDELDVFLNKYNYPIIIQEKYDGLSISVNYENGKLINAITRGDGIEGENITRNFLKMKNVKPKLDYNFTGSLKGEIILKKSDFDIVNSKSKKKFSNPRNGASGIAREWEGTFCQYLTVIYYDVMTDKQFKSEVDVRYFIKENLGFEGLREFEKELLYYCPHIDRDEVQNKKENQNLELQNKIDLIKKPRKEAVKEIYEYYINEKRDELDYLIDGFVIKIDNLSIQRKLGWSSGRPKGQIALKFPSSIKEATLLDIEWNVTRQGRIIPKARIQEIELDGSKINYATLHNYDFVNNMNFGRHDKVLLRKSGDIIPQIIGISKRRGERIIPPTECPSCGSELSLIDTKVHLICSNIDCKEQKIYKILHFVRTLKLDHVGLDVIEKLYDIGVIGTISDIFLVHDKYEERKDEILEIQGLRELKINNFLDQIKKRKKVTLSVLFQSMGQDLLGKKNSEKLEELIHITMEKNNLTLIDIINNEAIIFDMIETNFQEITSERLKKSYKNCIQTIYDLIMKQLVDLKVSEKNDILNGKSFCFTGKLEKMKRSEAEEMVKKNGGEIKGVSKDLTYLVTNDKESGSSKNKKAKSLGIEIINEKEFLKLLT